MPQEFLNHSQVDAPLQQMRRIGMAQCMDRSLLADSALEENDLEGLLQGGGAEGLMFLLVWKEIETGAVPFPVLAQQLQQSLREGNTPVLPPFAVAHPEQHPRAVDVLCLQGQTFGKTKATCIDDGQGHANGGGLDKGKDAFHFVGTQDDRELCPLFRANEIKDELFPLEGFLEEKFDPGKMDREGAARNSSLLHKVKEIRAEFFLGT